MCFFTESISRIVGENRERKYNNKARLFLGMYGGGFNIGYVQAGATNVGPVTEQADYSMTAQTIYDVTEGNTYPMYATAWRYIHCD